MLMRIANSYVRSDGNCMHPTKDPPGQRCIYITPGNPESEVYRLTTYKKFPNHVPIDYMKLAELGFYYTGYKDRVKCFGCGRTVEDWEISDNPRSTDWHASGCEMATGVKGSNIPLTRLLRRKPNTSSHVTRRRSTPQSQNQSAVNTSAVDTTPTNNNNNTQTANHESEQVQSMPTTNGQSSSQSMFPCNNPVNPHMRSAVSREHTFMSNRNWSVDRIRATPHQIAEAGLFYLGSRDRVKCWYCNGGLQNWEEGDEPWFEHAKWFPECEFVLQNKGAEFVENVNRQFPRLRRPTAPQPTNSSNNVSPQIIDPREPSNGNTSVRSASSSNTTTTSSPKEELTRLEQSKTCKKCLKEPATVLLLPCGHLVSCLNCSNNLKKCPLCKCTVKETFRTYIS